MRRVFRCLCARTIVAGQGCGSARRLDCGQHARLCLLRLGTVDLRLGTVDVTDPAVV